MIGHLGDFLLDFFGEIWTQWTLTHILGPILVIFDICHFLTIPGPFEYFLANAFSQKIKVFTTRSDHYPFIGLVLGGQVTRLNLRPV